MRHLTSNEQSKSDNKTAILLTALRAIAKHQEIVGGSMAKMSTTWVIATRAIETAGFSLDGDDEDGSTQSDE